MADNTAKPRSSHRSRPAWEQREPRLSSPVPTAVATFSVFWKSNPRGGGGKHAAVSGRGWCATIPFSTGLYPPQGFHLIWCAKKIRLRRMKDENTKHPTINTIISIDHYCSEYVVCIIVYTLTQPLSNETQKKCLLAVCVCVAAKRSSCVLLSIL